MGKEIDNHVAKLDLDSSGFLKGAEEVLKAIGKLETALEFKGAEKGVANVSSAIDSMQARVSGTLADTVSQMSAFTGSVSQAASTAVSSMNTVLAAVDGAASSVASSVTASAVCEHDANHVYSETVDTICEVTVKPTPESAGSGTYTAVFSAPMFASQVKNAAIPYVPLSIKSVSVNGSAVSVKLNGDVPADAVLAAAAYSQNGAMLRTALLKPTGNTAELTLNTGGAAYVKVFLITEDAYTPLCESIQRTVE